MSSITIRDWNSVVASPAPPTPTAKAGLLSSSLSRPSLQLPPRQATPVPHINAVVPCRYTKAEMLALFTPSDRPPASFGNIQLPITANDCHPPINSEPPSHNEREIFDSGSWYLPGARPVAGAPVKGRIPSVRGGRLPFARQRLGVADEPSPSNPPPSFVDTRSLRPRRLDLSGSVTPAPPPLAPLSDSTTPVTELRRSSWATSRSDTAAVDKGLTPRPANVGRSDAALSWRRNDPDGPEATQAAKPTGHSEQESSPTESRDAHADTTVWRSPTVSLRRHSEQVDNPSTLSALPNKPQETQPEPQEHQQLPLLAFSSSSADERQVSSPDEGPVEQMSHASLSCTEARRARSDSWWYKDPSGTVYGPFSSSEMHDWYHQNFFQLTLPVRCFPDSPFTPLGALFLQGDPAFLDEVPHIVAAPAVSSSPIVESSPLLRSSSIQTMPQQPHYPGQATPLSNQNLASTQQQQQHSRQMMDQRHQQMMDQHAQQMMEQHTVQMRDRQQQQPAPQMMEQQQHTLQMTGQHQHQHTHQMMSGQQQQQLNETPHPVNLQLPPFQSSPFITMSNFAMPLPHPQPMFRSPFGRSHSIAPALPSRPTESWIPTPTIPIMDHSNMPPPLPRTASWMPFANSSIQPPGQPISDAVVSGPLPMPMAVSDPSSVMPESRTIPIVEQAAEVIETVSDAEFPVQQSKMFEPPTNIYNLDPPAGELPSAVLPADESEKISGSTFDDMEVASDTNLSCDNQEAISISLATAASETVPPARRDWSSAVPSPPPMTTTKSLVEIQREEEALEQQRKAVATARREAQLQAQRQAAEQHATSTVWGTPINIPPVSQSLLEIQKQEEISQRARPTPSSSVQPSPAVAPAASWVRMAAPGLAVPVKPAVTMRQIQEEEEQSVRQQPRTQQSSLSGWSAAVAGSSTLQRAQTVPAASRQAPASVTPAINPKAKPVEVQRPANPPPPTDSGAEEDEPFWRFEAPQQSSQKPTKHRTTSRALASHVSSEFGGPRLSPAFQEWCKQQLASIPSDCDVLSLAEFLLTLNSSDAIREYIYQYLGRSPKIEQFACGFLMHKEFDEADVSTAKSRDIPQPGDDELIVEGSDATGSKKKNRRRRKKKSDLSVASQ